MVVSDAIHNIMGGMESTAGVRLHNHRRKLKQRFDIIKKLGQGTYGKVQLGINKETGQEVAIKTIKKSKIETDADLVRIRREIQIMSSVQHPNIIHIYEVFENREKMVLVMEYAAGGELYDYLSERKVLDETEARRIFRQISTAVYYCHKHKICHRDLKLENILLDEHGSAKIADFGLSNVFDEQRLLGTFCGSPLYASPEIVKGTPYHGPEVDCWSLGVLLYTLVYGAMPFDGSNFKRLVKQISQGDYFEPKKPSPASSLIRDMLNVNPACRADIEKICAHRWVNESQSQSCVEIAEELANQTPVRLDLLLSLAPPPASADALLVAKDQDAAAAAAGPARSQSVGSLMELDHPRTFDAEKRRLSEAGQLPASVKESPAKRKLEQGPSTEEANQSGAKRKERSRHRDREHSSERRHHRSGSRSKQSTSKAESSRKATTTQEPGRIPLPDEAKAAETVPPGNREENAPPELMDVDPDASPATRTAETEATKKVEEVTEEVAKTPVEEAPKVEVIATEEIKSNEEGKKVKVKRKKKTDSDLKLADSKEEAAKVDETVPKKEAEGELKDSSQKEEASAKVEPVPKETEPSATVEGDKPKESPQESQAVKPDAPAEVKEKKVLKKIGTVKKKSDLSQSKIAQAADKPPEEPAPPAKPMVRRRSKIFESEIQKFNNMSAADLKAPGVAEKPKKVFIPGVKVSDFKKAYERKSSVDLSSTTSVPSAVKAPVNKTEKTGVEDREIGDGDKSQPSEEINVTSAATEAGKETVENSKKPVDVEPSTKKVVKPDDSPSKNTRSVNSADSISVATEKEKVAGAPTTKESQDKVESITSTDVVEGAKSEPVGSPAVKDESAAKRQKAVSIIGNAIAKPPKPTLDKLKLRTATVKSPPESPKKKTAGDEGRKLVPNQASAPERASNEGAKTDEEGAAGKANVAQNVDDKEQDRPADAKKSSKVEIVLKSATLPRRKTSKAEIRLGAPKAPEYRTEVEHMVGAPPSNRLQNQRSEVAFPVAAAVSAGPPHRSMSVEPEGAVKAKPKERIIPIQFERPAQERSAQERPSVSSPPPSKPPVPPLSQQRSMSQSQRSNSLSRQSTLDSDTESTGTVSGGPEPIRKSPREYIIPIAVEGGGYVTPRAGSLEPESASESATHKPRKPHRFPRTMRMGSLLSDGGLSEDEGFNSISSPFGTLNRHREQREGEPDDEKGFHHMHKLRSSRPSRRPTLEHADSVSSAEEEEDDDEDDGFELLTAESLFSTLLSRVRNLTQRLNVDDNRTGFPSSRFMNHNFPSHSSLWGNMEPMSRRVSETSRPSRDESGSSWRRSASRDTDCDSQYSDVTSSLPRGSSRHDFDEMSDVSNSSYPSYYTPSLARRIQRTNQELRNRSSTNVDSSYGQLPPRDYTTLPSRRSMSRTSSVKSEDGTRRPAHFVPTRSPSCLDSSRDTDKNRSFERSGSVERYMPQVGNGDGGYLRGNASGSENSSFDRDSSVGRRSTSYLGSKSSLGSSDSLDYVGKRDYSRERSKRVSESDAAKSYLPPTRRNVSMLDGNTPPRRHAYRSSMSDMADYTRRKPDDYRRSHSQISEEVNGHETLPPLPQSSGYGRKRDAGVQKSSSYLRQRAIDIANIYGAPLPAAEPTRLERDSVNGKPHDHPYEGYRSGTATPTNQEYSTFGRSSFDERMALKYGEEDQQRGRSQIPKVSRFRSSSLSREEESSRSESVRDTIVRRQKSSDRLDQSQDKPRMAKLQRPSSLSLQATTDGSVLSKFFNGDGKPHESNGTEENNPTSPVRSPGRRVSRFLRPDFYDTPREESAFAKERDDAAKVSKEAEEQQRPERESEQYYKDLGEKLANKSQLFNTETESNSTDSKINKPKSVAEQETRLESSEQRVVANTSQRTSSNANAGTEQNGRTNVAQLNKNTEIPKVSESLVPMEPKIAKVFKPKVIIKKDPISTLPKPVESSVKIPEANLTKDIKPKLINKGPVITVPKRIDEIVKPTSPAISKEVKDVPSKIPLQTDSQLKLNQGASIDVLANSSNISQEKTVAASAQEAEPKVPNVAEATNKIKVKRKIKKPAGSDLATKTGDTQGAKSDSKVMIPAGVDSSSQGAMPSGDKSKLSDPSDGKVETATGGAKSRIEQVIRSLRERSLTPKGSDDILTVSNLLKRAVSVDNCSGDSNASKSTNKITRVIRSLRELTSTPKSNVDTETNLLKRAVSVDDCSNPSQTKSNKVNSVLGIFRKMEEPKGDAKLEKKASLLSRFRKTQSLYAGSASDSVLVQNLDKREVKAKGVISNGRKFGFRGSKPDKVCPSVEPAAGTAAPNGTSADVAESFRNHVPDVATLNSDSNVSCSVKIRLPEKEVSKRSQQNGTPNGNEDDVSISTTIKIFKDVTKESGSKTKLPSRDAETVPKEPRVNSENGVKADARNRDADSKPRNYSKIPQITTNKGPTCDEAARTAGQVEGSDDKTGDPRSVSSMPSEEDLESFDDSCSVCSDWEFRTSPLPAYHHRVAAAEPDGAETMQERIRRKSFFSRFNDTKKKPVTVRRASTTTTNHAPRENHPDEI